MKPKQTKYIFLISSYIFRGHSWHNLNKLGQTHDQIATFHMVVPNYLPPTAQQIETLHDKFMYINISKTQHPPVSLHHDHWPIRLHIIHHTFDCPFVEIDAIIDSFCVTWFADLIMNRKCVLWWFGLASE